MASVQDHLASHRDLLADRDRVGAMVRGVVAAVTPGDVVVDIGTGTGVLAVAAAKAGAGKVYAIEAVSAVADVAQQVITDNGVGDRVTLIEGHSTQVEIPDSADVLVAELVGAFGLEEDILEYVDDGRRRFLRQGGRLVPDVLRLYAAPTTEGGGLNSWRQEILDHYELDLSSAEAYTRHLPRNLTADAEQLIGLEAIVLECDLSQPQSGVPSGGGQSTITGDGWLSGWVGWFEIGSQGRSLLTTRPPAPGSSWGHVLFPTVEPMRVRAGDTARLEVRFDRPFWSWTISVGDTNSESSEFESMPAASLLTQERA
jgi:hypothetical protein